MKVLQVLPELNSGGVERGTLEVADHLVKNGHEALVVSSGGRLVGALEDSGARHITMPVHKKSLGSLFQIRPLRRLLETEKPDILHIRSRVPGWIAYLAWRGMDPATRPRLVSTVHGFYSVNRYSAVMTKGERVIAVSESIKSYILTNYPKVPENNITVIYRGILPEMYPRGFLPSEDWLDRWRKDFPHLEGKTVLLLPGRITRLKGHSDFFSMIRDLTAKNLPVHGLVVGDTHPKKRGYLEELKAAVSSDGLDDDVTFTGHRNDVREIMAVSDVVFALSQQPESFGRTVLEAMALGKPVIGYDCGGVGELLGRAFPEGKVPPSDHKLLLEAASRIISGRYVPSVPEGVFTLESMCRTTLGLYTELVSGDR